MGLWRGQLGGMWMSLCGRVGMNEGVSFGPGVLGKKGICDIGCDGKKRMVNSVGFTLWR